MHEEAESGSQGSQKRILSEIPGTQNELIRLQLLLR